MDQMQIGKFIAACRKEQGLTQAQLAEQLGISDRAVSKWETGRSLPDAALMQPLCEIIGIDLNELFSGRRIEMENYKEIAEQNLLEMKKQEEQSNRVLLQMEIAIGVVGVAGMLALLLAANYTEQLWLRIVCIVAGIVLFLVSANCGLYIEQRAGYYECGECHERYVPSFFKLFFAPHIGRTRQMRCPHCGKRSWQKKVLTKD